ncbi:MAG: secretion protein HlyD, partial [Gammaproteobacteria bacterium]
MKNVIRIAAFSIVCLALSACEMPTQIDPGSEMAAGDYERGPNNGRMLRDGAVAVELAIFESGVPPEFRAWVTSDGQPVDPADVDLTV